MLDKCKQCDLRELDMNQNHQYVSPPFCHDKKFKKYNWLLITKHSFLMTAEKGIIRE